jgi:hypothetical protein
MGSPSPSRRGIETAADEVALLADLVVGVRVADSDCARRLPTGRPCHRLACRLLHGHPDRGEDGLGRAPVRRRKPDQPRVDAGQGARRLEGPGEDRVEVDARADLGEVTGALRLDPGCLERGRKVAVQRGGSLKRFLQHPLDGRIGASPPANDDEEDDE